jgi:hypothetical protein
MDDTTSGGPPLILAPDPRGAGWRWAWRRAAGGRAGGWPVACRRRPVAAPIAPPTQSPSRARVRAGDRWRYVETNGFNGERVAEIAARWSRTARACGCA